MQDKSKTTIVFLLGDSGVGKDTAGERFVKEGYTRVAFADKVKEEVANHYKCSLDDLHIQGPVKETWRPIIIDWAEKKREIDPNHWIREAFKPFLDSEGYFREGEKIVITDMRRKSEVDWVLEEKKKINEVNAFMINSGMRHYVEIKLVYITRPGHESGDALTSYTIGYAEGINKVFFPKLIDFKIINDKDKDVFIKKIDFVINEIN